MEHELINKNVYMEHGKGESGDRRGGGGGRGREEERRQIYITVRPPACKTGVKKQAIRIVMDPMTDLNSVF